MHEDRVELARSLPTFNLYTYHCLPDKMQQITFSLFPETHDSQEM